MHIEHIKPGSLEDKSSSDMIESVLELYRLARPELEEDRGRMLDELTGDGQELFIARDEEDDDRVVGVTSYYKPAHGKHFYLSGIAVDPDLQGLRVVGPLMMNSLMDIARAAGVRAIEGQSLPAARAFYERLGAIALGGDRMRFELR